jgi:hypothetical protein
MLQELVNAGLTPVNALLVAALIIGGRVIRNLHAKQTADRESWHKETHQRIDAMQGHIDQCDRDRLQLHKEIAVLAAKVNERPNCSREDCPLKG